MYFASGLTKVSIFLLLNLAQLELSEHFSPFKVSSAEIKIGV